MITAILVFQQVDAGALALDAPVASYVQLATLPNADHITIRQLLAHRSGLAGQTDTPDGPPGDLMQYCAAAAAEPGTAFLYNNCDTIVLGKVLEAVTGSTYLDLVNARIGAPLGVTLTLPNEPRVEATMKDGAAEATVWPSAYGPSGGLYGAIGDLLKIDAALMDGRLMSAESLAIMLTGDPASGYAALSVWSYSPDLGACLGQTRLVERYGEIGGVQVRNFLLPDKGVALSVYSNDGATDFGEVWRGQGLSIDLIRAAACGAPGA
jgi:CubicO group peptidase (beta-lactamase class C family)